MRFRVSKPLETKAKANAYSPPAPEIFVSAISAWPAALRRPDPPAMLTLPPSLN